MKNAFYHMSVWNVRDTKEVINKLVSGESIKSVGEQVRNAASELRVRKKRQLGATSCGSTSHKTSMISIKQKNFVAAQNHPAAVHYASNLVSNNDKQRTLFNSATVGSIRPMTSQNSRGSLTTWLKTGQIAKIGGKKARKGKKHQETEVGVLEQTDIVTN
jgi:hypothetical protein